MGNTNIFCPKRLESGYVVGVKGWGNFVTTGGCTVGEGVTVNKWLRGGRVPMYGGRAIPRGTNAGNNLDENINNVVIMPQSSEHALFGCVALFGFFRILHGGGFTFYRMVTNINTY